ncbi:MAG: hypothetical protein HFH87_09640 [Lachnospiraceae bacterium]|nr:hypothetical protein [Lachnospiraceae bacterium]
MKKLKLLKRCICFAIMFVLSFPVTVSAAEDKNTGDLNTTNFETMISLDTLQPGDVLFLGMLGEEKLCVEVVYDSEYSTYGLGDQPVRTKTYVLYKENILGIKTDLFSVTTTCRWKRYEKIESFECTAESLHSSVTCSWYREVIENPTFWARTLKVTYGGLSSEDVIFSAGLDAENDKLYLKCSWDFE